MTAAFLVFAIAWSTYPRNRQVSLLLAGFMFLGVAVLDLLHLLVSLKMPLWPADEAREAAVGYWLTARLLAALAALLLTVRQLPVRLDAWGRPLLFAATLGLLAILGLAIIQGATGTPAAPAAAVPAQAPAHLATEVLVLLICTVAMVRLARKPAASLPVDGRQLVVALLTMMAAECFFAVERSSLDLYQLVGHIYKAVAYYQLYLALFVGMVRVPFQRLEEARGALRQSESNLAALFHASPDGILVVSAQGVIVRANPQAATMFGYGPGELEGHPHACLLPEAKRSGHEAVVREYLANRQARLMANGSRSLALRKDGSTFPVEIGLSPVTLGSDAHVIATIRDVSPREHLERQLEASETRLRSFLDNAVDWVWDMDAQGRFSYSSRSIEGLLGYRPEEVLGKLPADFMAEEEAARVTPIWRRMQLFRQSLSQFEHVCRHRDGRLVMLETSCVPYYGSDGSLLGQRGISRDVTLRNQTHAALEASEQRFRLAFDHSPIGMGITSPDGVILHANATLATMLGYAESEVIEKNLRDVVHPADYEASTPLLKALLSGRIPVAAYETRYRHKAGHDIWTQTSIVAAGSPGQPKYLLAQIQDVSDERENRLRNARLLAIIERTEVAIGTVAANGRMTYLNPAARRMLGITMDDPLVRMRVSEFYPSEASAQIQERAVPTARRAGVWEGETLWRSLDGSVIPVWQTIMAHKNSHGEVDYWSTIAQDLRESKSWQETLAFQHSHDMLTALPNRYLMQDRLQQAIANAKRSERLVAVLVIDIDHFKRINDSLGHTSGDMLLLEFSQRLRHGLRESDSFGRQGGDEFIVLLSEVALVQDVVAIAEKLNASCDAPFQVQDRDLFVTASIGISVFPFDEDNPDELLRKAEVAMYRAKDQGRNTYQFYTGDMDKRYREDLEVEADLRHAIERDQLQLHYQPKFRIADGKLVGFEALLRWYHPQLGLLPPGRFIPVAERSNLIVTLGEWALTTACRQMVAWQQQGLQPGHVAVNVSAQQFEYSDVAGMVKRVLAETGLEPSCLELEITESILMRDPAVTSRLLDELKSLRIGVAIDDFGTGYSSLSYLKRFPVDVLKIDRAFVKEVASSDDDAAIVRAVVSMAHALDIRVVAEGIETQEQHDFLHECGCDLAQGFLFGRPVDAEASRIVLETQLSTDDALE